MEVIAAGYGLTEAPRYDSLGRLWFTDVTGGGVHRIGRDGEIETVVPKRRGVGGLALHEDGGVVMSGRDLIRIAPDGEQSQLLALDEATGFNDIAADADGNLLAGMLRYNPLQGEAVVPGALVRVFPDGRHQVVAEGIHWPNGVGVSPDGSVIYMADYARENVLRISGGETEEFARSPRGSCDGLAVDEEGGVWVALGAGQAIARFGPGGSLEELVEVDTQFVTSVEFGGDDGRDLFVTTLGSVLRGRAPLAGMRFSLRGP